MSKFSYNCHICKLQCRYVAGKTISAGVNSNTKPVTDCLQKAAGFDILLIYRIAWQTCPIGTYDKSEVTYGKENPAARDGD
ncbi:hypothetical protein C823_006664 [Eubacterium plexicaudatum ASF492]|uniref:Uncharacterized protein n=1 Tax=Eubacterium plexicaudatum ASF492 TaxID=1235802 RepID=N2ACF5_9FIRM|nr:hypothetical protein C823_006664 [Eubacterium plexicaudatum ASF492]